MVQIKKTEKHDLWGLDVYDYLIVLFTNHVSAVSCGKCQSYSTKDIINYFWCCCTCDNDVDTLKVYYNMFSEHILSALVHLEIMDINFTPCAWWTCLIWRKKGTWSPDWLTNWQRWKDIPYFLDDEQALHALRKLVMDKHLKGIDKVLHQFLVIFNIIIFLNRIHFCNRHTEAVQLF